MESHRRYRTVPSTAHGMEVSSFKRTFLPLEKVTILVYMSVAFSLMNSSLLCSPVDRVASIITMCRRVRDKR